MQTSVDGDTSSFTEGTPVSIAGSDGFALAYGHVVGDESGERLAMDRGEEERERLVPRALRRVGLFKKITIAEVVTQQRDVVLDRDQVFDQYGETIKHKADRNLGAFYDAGNH